jgi:hypothetical protein
LPIIVRMIGRISVPTANFNWVYSQLFTAPYFKTWLFFKFTVD